MWACRKDVVAEIRNHPEVFKEFCVNSPRDNDTNVPFETYCEEMEEVRLAMQADCTPFFQHQPVLMALLYAHVLPLVTHTSAGRLRRPSGDSRRIESVEKEYHCCIRVHRNQKTHSYSLSRCNHYIVHLLLPNTQWFQPL